jgi:hypothetical protein
MPARLDCGGPACRRQPGMATVPGVKDDDPSWLWNTDVDESRR